jgi:hypothetical protein
VFILKLEGRDLERLLKLAAEKGVPAERVARLALLKGLRLLAKTDDGEASGMRVHGFARRKSVEEVHAYIRKNWWRRTDKEMGEALGYAARTVWQYRSSLGLSKQKKRAEPIKALIREHWETKSDREISRLMDPPCSPLSVKNWRKQLGLKRRQGQEGGVTIREAIDPAEFERMVLREGYTVPEYIRFKNLRCSPQRLREVAISLGLKYLKKYRSPEWALMRKARRRADP